MGLILWILIGAAAGWFATRMLEVRTTPLQTVLIGMAGALVGGLIVKTVLAVLGVLAGIIGAIGGAVLVLWLWDRYAR
ncbi:GlsB/YeaQ/YmgE family stress response membrane protein [Pseudooceanicola sp. 216_PA32_1]|uniref:GlsB/YeaQ/YmgE family stress response membrane protein n=1 Tax=Pseudooceanicola pacificus TaxID=2676438 RepID=A0A844WAK7_9RHOB|nr:GlsB/YeaQ/YmgE family stress response membrane protein [Pseudooceanicola pacificus]MWB76742.1 GlsB/YeaQ/YmgE family stress response membrane protein [Pseudooceanicola pacificus]